MLMHTEVVSYYRNGLQKQGKIIHGKNQEYFRTQTFPPLHSGYRYISFNNMKNEGTVLYIEPEEQNSL